MSRLLTSILACVLLLAPSFAQSPQEGIADLNQKAIAALGDKHYDEGIGYLQRILEINPKDHGTAYNMACAYSLKNDVDKAFEWMNKAIDWGWGTGEGTLVNTTKPISHVEMTRSDPDLENMRKDPRFDALIKRMENRGKAATEYAATAAVYIPEKIAQAAEMPLLVVLHDNGSTKDRVISGRWKAIADELGTALVAPSGKTLVADEPSKGMAWWDDPGAFQQKPWTFEKTVDDAVTAFKKDHKLDKSRVFIAGEGAGTLVAFDAAVRSPGLYKGVVGLNGGMVPQILTAKAPAAAKMGLKMKLFVDPAEIKKGLPPDQDVAKIVEGWNQAMQAWGMTGGVASFTPDAKDPKQIDKLLIDALKSMPAAASTTEAGAPK
jgi:predicted esterase